MSNAAHLAQPPSATGSLSDFPAFNLTPSLRVFRIHAKDYGPWWFSTSMKSRFDLADPDGTCYVAESRLGAFVERFQDFSVIPFSVIRDSKIASLQLPQPLRLADCTAPQARRFGMTGEIHTVAARDITQAWAQAFSRDGFDGMRYFARHDPSMKRKSIAIFGAAGEVNWPVVHDRRIDKRLIQRAKEVFGIKVLDTLS